MNNLIEKIKESLSSVLPITIIVVILHFVLTPMPTGLFMLFLTGAILLIVGMGLFTLGADISMMPMGERIGAELTKSRKLMALIIISFLMGFMITVAEPDLQVLAGQVPSIADNVIIGAVAFGVGIFLVISLLRIVFQIKLSYVLLVFYAIIFILAYFTPNDFVPVAFDSGGVTTGPITVPFIMALGLGVAAVRGGKSAHDDSFGLVALCSVGPVLSVLVLGLFYNTSGSYEEVVIAEVSNFRDIINIYMHEFPHFFKEVALALSPIVIAFIIFQFIFLKLPKTHLIKLSVGIIYTFLGLVVFLTGVNVGFLPAGNYIGHALAGLDYNWMLIPIGMVMGFFIVAAEPAVHVLNKQVEEVTGGAISKRAMLISLSLGVAVSIGIAMIRILTGISIWYFIVPGYAIALLLMFYVPQIFTGIAFDSGGVASGPMTATFMLPFAMGAADAVGGNILTDAFGLVAMVAMTPLITIQILGVVYKLKVGKFEKVEENITEDESNEIIDLEGGEQ
ncbi:DUF1538 domain-containing protein [Sedimentibacter hydroxybenzoicus DSM 7310]|uniref:DUF1538 domain-containing protein n=1 Tax=Sedimentibacter hydroxybenzoicus DSM 7310 TaxID=1123245 RepID=A0A974GXU8_SEDHY|nr:DUF1538 domain-containing protein [Sedimentibacter hydroxybenzoicus]NYB75430.1 DUF1538 domain-containing protein [Sedimentibacter hydroxybenzoicus DSM 7310]